MLLGSDRRLSVVELERVPGGAYEPEAVAGAVSAFFVLAGEIEVAGGDGRVRAGRRTGSPATAGRAGRSRTLARIPRVCCTCARDRLSAPASPAERDRRPITAKRGGTAVRAVPMLQVIEMRQHPCHGARCADEDAAGRRTLLMRLVGAEEDQRQAFATALHDDPIQVMAAACMQLASLRRACAGEPGTVARLDELEHTVGIAISHLRSLVLELLPPGLRVEGLAPALELYVAYLDRDTDAAYGFHDGSRAEPDDETTIVLYRLAQQVLGVIRRHAHAAKVAVTLADGDEGCVHLRVEADGTALTGDALEPAAVALAAIRERAETAGGGMRIGSEAGATTVVECWIPGASARLES